MMPDLPLRSSPATTDGAADSVGSALRTFLKRHDADTETLREIIAAYVQNARERGWPPERVLVQVKTIVEREVAPSSRDWSDKRALPAQIVSWTVDAYFRAD